MSKSNETQPGILPLVEALNAIPGVEIIGSCQGRIRWSWWLREVPYVYFRAPNDLAEHIADFLHQDMVVRRPHLGLPWKFQGLFHPERGLCFHLRGVTDPIQSARDTILQILGIAPRTSNGEYRNSLEYQLLRDIQNLAGWVRLYEPVQQPMPSAGTPSQPDEHTGHRCQDDKANGICFPLGVGMTTKGADLGPLADLLLTGVTLRHPILSHTEPPSCESLADLLVRTLHRCAAAHGKALSQKIIAEALAITTIRTVGVDGRPMGILAPRDFEPTPRRNHDFF